MLHEMQDGDHLESEIPFPDTYKTTFQQFDSVWMMESSRPTSDRRGKVLLQDLPE